MVAGLWWEHEFLETQVRVAVKIRTVLWQEHDLGRRTREGLWQADDVAQWREQPFELRQMATPGGLKKEARQDCDFRPKTPNDARHHKALHACQVREHNRKYWILRLRKAVGGCGRHSG